MTTVVGIDLSLTSTGLARLSSHIPVVETKLATSKGHNNDTLTQRFERQTILTNQVLEFARDADLVCIEYIFASGQVGGSQIDRFGLWWRVVGSLLLWQIPVLHPTASQGKKFLTGSGKADKGTMVRCALRTWPDWEPSTNSASEDEADAIAMASIGVALLEAEHGQTLPFEMPKYRVDVMDKLKVQAKEIGHPWTWIA